MGQSNFDRLLHRYLTGQVTEEERRKIEAWLDIAKNENGSGLDLTKEDEERLFLKITGDIDKTREIQTPAQQPSSRSRKTWLLKIAAGIVLCFAAAYSIGWLSRRAPLHDTASTTGIEKVILNDGTLVWLRTASQLRFYENNDDGTRNLEFQGEALFEVAKDARHPFIIQCGDAAIRVVGTSFRLRNMGDSLELNVLTGKVNFSSGTGIKDLTVEPAEKLTYIHNQIRKSAMHADESVSLTAGTDYTMQFTDATLEEVMHRVGKKFNVKFTTEHTQIGACRITADFTDRSLESTMQMITEVLDVRYSREGDTVMLTGPGCQPR